MVKRPLLERNLVDMFISTLQGPYLDRMVGSISSRFSDLVIAGEQVENCLKIGKIHDTITVASGAKKYQSGFPKNKEGETNATTTSKGENIAYQMTYY